MQTDITPEGAPKLARIAAPNPAISPDFIQGEVDRLFVSTKPAAPVAADMGQSVVDRMFDWYSDSMRLPIPANLYDASHTRRRRRRQRIFCRG
jgi:hypothetical protein